MTIERKIELEHKSYRRVLYKKLTTYILIALEKKIKENDKIKTKFNQLILDNAKNYKLVRSYKKVVREAKVDWIEFESALKIEFTKGKKNKEWNINLYKDFSNAIKKIDSQLEHNPNNDNLVSKSFLFLYIDKILTWCKKHYNRMSQIKKRKREYNKKWNLNNEGYYKDYYIANKQSFKSRYENNKLAIKEKYKNIKTFVKSRAEINQEFNSKRHLDSKNLVLEYALKMLSNNEKLTIRALNATLINANQKLGNTQISLYLKELKSEGLIDE